MKARIIPIALLLALACATLTAHDAHAFTRAAWWTDAEALAKKDGYALVDEKGLAQLGEAGADFLLLDARPDYEFKAGHLPGAVNFELDLGDRQGLVPQKRAAFQALLGPDKDRPVVVYCRSFR